MRTEPNLHSSSSLSSIMLLMDCPDADDWEQSWASLSFVMILSCLSTYANFCATDVGTKLRCSVSVACSVGTTICQPISIFLLRASWMKVDFPCVDLLCPLSSQNFASARRVSRDKSTLFLKGYHIPSKHISLSLSLSDEHSKSGNTTDLSQNL